MKSEKFKKIFGLFTALLLFVILTLTLAETAYLNSVFSGPLLGAARLNFSSIVAIAGLCAAWISVVGYLIVMLVKKFRGHDTK
jgi:hypothetical protein